MRTHTHTHSIWGRWLRHHFMALLMMVSAYAPLVAQANGPCDIAGFSLRAGDIETVDCFTVKVPVRLLSSSSSFAACNFDISGTVSGGNARIEAIDLSSGFASYSLINDQEGFTVFGNDGRTIYTSGALQPPLFEVTLRVDPGEVFNFVFTDIDINLGCVPLPNYQCDEGDFSISYVGLPFEGPMPTICDSESRDVELFLDYPSPSTLSAATVDIPLKIRDNDNLSGSITLEKLDFGIAYDDVYGGLEVFPNSSLTAPDLSAANGRISGTFVPDFGNNNFTLTLDANGEAQLATITVYTPTEPIAGGEIDFTFDFARIQEYDSGGNGACCSPELGAPGTVTFQNESFPCQGAEGLKLQIEAPEIIEGGKYKFPVFLYGPDAAQFTIDNLLLEMELISSGDAIIDPATAGTVAAEYCPGGSCASQGSAYPQNGQCIEIRENSKVVAFGLCQSVTNAYRAKVFDIIVSSDDPCVSIDDLKVRLAKWNNLDITGGLCVLSMLDKGFTENDAGHFPVGEVVMECNPNPFVRAPVEEVTICALPAGATSCSCASLPFCEFSYTTNKEGYYTTPDCTQDEEYVLTACKTDTEDLLCGVSTGDLVLISKHILGVRRFDSPRQYIAADVNRSRSITTLDLIEIRKAILGISIDLAGQPHWRFIPCGYSFPNTDPFETGVPECLEYSSATGYSACFDAIKIGDVDCSCAGELVTVGEFVIALKEKAPPEGSGEDDVRVDLAPDNNTYLAALQFALRFDTNYLSFSGFLEEATLVDTNAYSFQEQTDGVVRLAWYNLTGDSTYFSTSSSILSMVFTPQGEEEDILSHISIDTTLLPPLAFLNDGTALRVRLKSLEEGGSGRPMPGHGAGIVSNEAFSITPVPNPFQQGLAFHISAQTAMEAQLSIFDARGKQVYAEVLALDAGQQKVRLPAADTWPEGAYFYRLQAGESVQSGRLVKLQ
ncbi:MAG: T9SS type A sorting domain-containing protein [Lewinellaceae bacterium]|nr:T9SS type A sorting domain-containing protein [Lewinellaceae bacterium]